MAEKSQKPKLTVYPTPFLEYRGILTLCRKLKKERPESPIGIVLPDGEEKEVSPYRWISVLLKETYLSFGAPIPEKIKIIFFPSLTTPPYPKGESPKDNKEKLSSQWFDQFLASGKEIFCSYPLMDSLGREIEKSPWLEGKEFESHLESPDLTKIPFAPRPNLHSPEAMALLKEELAQHTFSATELESYQDSPFQHFAKYLLKLKPVQERTPELDPGVQGQLIHHLLETLFSKMGPEMQGIPTEKIDEFVVQGINLVREELNAEEKTLGIRRSKLWEHRKKRILRAIETFFREELLRFQEGFKKLIPSHFEWRFGKKEPYLFPTEAGPVALTGVIDRIDIDPERKKFLVLDYKTGSKTVSMREFEAGRALQLPLYVAAATSLLLKNHQPIGGIFCRLQDLTRKEGFVKIEDSEKYLCLDSRSQAAISGQEWEAIMTRTGKTVAKLVAGMKKGDFSQQAEECEGFCEFRDICRCGS